LAEEEGGSILRLEIDRLFEPGKQDSSWSSFDSLFSRVSLPDVSCSRGVVEEEEVETSPPRDYASNTFFLSCSAS